MSIKIKTNEIKTLQDLAEVVYDCVCCDPYEYIGESLSPELLTQIINVVVEDLNSLQG
jgi:hypothetical protein